MENMDTQYPQTEEEILDAYPHLRKALDIKHERMMRLRTQGKTPNSSKPNPDRLATMTNIRSHLRATFPKQVFRVEPLGHSAVRVSWTRWEEPFGNSPTEQEVSGALDWFRHWPLDRSKNEPAPKESFRIRFLKTFGGTSRLEIQADEPTAKQMARKQSTMLRKVARQSASKKTEKKSTGGPKL